MSRFMTMAEEAISKYKSGGVDAYLDKFAEDKGLNLEEHQRLVEEYNIGSFLNKMKDGTQHEEYEVASPVVTISSSDEGGPSVLGKVASVNDSDKLTPDMFILSDELQITSDPELNKMAHISDDDYLFNSEEKWRKADDARKELAADTVRGLEKLASDSRLHDALSTLVKVAGESEGMTKTAISVMTSGGHRDLAEHIRYNTKFSPSEILSAKAEELPKSAFKAREEAIEET